MDARQTVDGLSFVDAAQAPHIHGCALPVRRHGRRQVWGAGGVGLSPNTRECLMIQRQLMGRCGQTLQVAPIGAVPDLVSMRRPIDKNSRVETSTCIQGGKEPCSFALRRQLPATFCVIFLLGSKEAGPENFGVFRSPPVSISTTRSSTASSWDFNVGGRPYIMYTARSLLIACVAVKGVYARRCKVP